jgi:hypothetical protein
MNVVLTGHFNDIFCGPATMSSSSDTAAIPAKFSQFVKFNTYMTAPTLVC